MALVEAIMTVPLQSVSISDGKPGAFSLESLSDQYLDTERSGFSFLFQSHVGRLESMRI
jgi:hypothetical protein